MNEYKVVWEIDLSADSLREAAELAREIQLDPLSTATSFIVYNEEGDYVEINLLDGAHDWECVSPGEYDFLYRCTRCGKEHLESIDNPGSEPPMLGCEGKGE